MTNFRYPLLPDEDKISFKDSSSVDAFGLLRTGYPVSLIDLKQDPLQSLLILDLATGSGGDVVYSSSRSSSTLSVSTDSSSYAILQSKQYCFYQPGKSQKITMTGILGSSQPNTVKRIGYFDDNNGLFFELSRTSLSVVRRSDVSGSVVDTVIPQIYWNLDRLDGSGASKISIDFTKAQIFVIDFQWLGVGRIRFGFFNGGGLTYCHEISNANNIDSVFMRTADLPVRWEIRNTDTPASTASLEAICASVISEGGHDPKGLTFSADNGINTKSIDTTLTPLVQLRHHPSYVRSHAIIKKISIFCEAIANYRYELTLNSTASGDNASWVTIPNSVIQYDVSSTATVSGGTLILSGYVSNQVRETTIDIDNIIPFYADIEGNSDILTLAVQRVTGNNAGFAGSILWIDLL